MLINFFDCDNDLFLFKVPVVEMKPTPEAPKATVTPQKVSLPQGTVLGIHDFCFLFFPFFS